MRILSMRWDFKLIMEQALDLMFPAHCAGCHAPGSLLCDFCSEKIYFVRQSCFICKHPAQHGFTHQLCLDKMLEQNYPSRLLVACDYKQELVKNIICNFKYEGIRSFDGICAKILIKFLRTSHYSFGNNWLVSFVPMHQSKLNTRAYNQAQLLAIAFASALHLSVQETLIKLHKTKAQMDLDRPQRKVNLKNAFAAQGDIRDKNILLIDDVTTTGSTFRECAKTLLAAGASDVCCFALARD